MDNDEDYFVPLEDQRVFGAGIKRKRIAFVPSSTIEPSISAVKPSGKSVEDKYLAIVTGKSDSKNSQVDTVASDIQQISEHPTCSVCQLPLVLQNEGQLALNIHEASIAHQMCLAHSHPPSHLNRQHVGLKYLKGYGWDPDERKGLGARQEGIRIPIKAKKKIDTTGLGHANNDDGGQTATKVRERTGRDSKIFKLDAKQTRKMEKYKHKQAEKLRQSFYGEDLSLYLGPDG